jgi:hypothetical protein
MSRVEKPGISAEIKAICFKRAGMLLAEIWMPIRADEVARLRVETAVVLGAVVVPRGRPGGRPIVGRTIDRGPSIDPWGEERAANEGANAEANEAGAPSATPSTPPSGFGLQRQRKHANPHQRGGGDGFQGCLHRVPLAYGALCPKAKSASDILLSPNPGLELRRLEARRGVPGRNVSGPCWGG